MTFDVDAGASRSGIGPIFVINLDRQKSRWTDTVRELDGIIDAQGNPLSARASRCSAYDAQSNLPIKFNSNIIEQFYTLADQLFVEPQPQAVPDNFELERPIKMSRAELAVACSHIEIWRKIAEAAADYSLILEDDILIEHRFGRILDEAWREMEEDDETKPKFDILYVSYEEVRNGAPKELVSPNVFRPERGLWYLSGYVLSRKGAQTLLSLLPCRGPIDLWLNHQFKVLDVRALRRSVIRQRRDLYSTNTYSILPALTGLGVLDVGTSALFHGQLIYSPVFAFGSPGSALSALAMALSLLGYCCCSDFDSIPESEAEALLAGRANRVFNAYVNIGSLEAKIGLLIKRYPRARFILVKNADAPADIHQHDLLAALEGVNLLSLGGESTRRWLELCEFLKLATPQALYPSVNEVGQRTRLKGESADDAVVLARRLRHDPSPWITKAEGHWSGIRARPREGHKLLGPLRVCFDDHFAQIHPARWQPRNDTFPGNLALFRSANVISAPGRGLLLAVSEESLGVRKFSAAAISSRGDYLFGRFEATLQATNVPGLVTGFFLHRVSPRQEIDIELAGNRPNHLLVNVFYNPGAHGAKFDYGFRGTPMTIDLGFDASKAFHTYTIEWDPNEIRWFVDRKLVHSRAIWNPTPIPNLPMTLHVNTWPTASRLLAGRLALRSLPARAALSRVTVEAYDSLALNRTTLAKTF